MIELQTSGFQEMIDRLEKMDKEGESIIKNALNASIKIVQKAIQRLAPVYTGKAKKGVVPGLLKANILIGKVRKSKDGSYSQVVGPTKGDITKVFYGKFQEWGWIPLRKGETSTTRARLNYHLRDPLAKVNLKKGALVGTEYGTSKNHAQPFIRPGFDQSASEAYARMETDILDGIEKVFKG